MTDCCTAAHRCNADAFNGADMAGRAARKGADVHPDSPLHRCTNPIGAAVVVSTAYNRRWRALAQAAIRRHPWCEDCGSRDDLTGDHRIPVSLGGMNVPGNVAVRCRPCNSRKGNRPEARTQLALDLWRVRT